MHYAFLLGAPGLTQLTELLLSLENYMRYVVGFLFFFFFVRLQEAQVAVEFLIGVWQRG